VSDPREKVLNAAPTEAPRGSPVRKGNEMAGQVNSRDVVRREDGTWGVTKPRSQRASAVVPPQAEAIQRAKGILGANGGELRIHGLNGQVSRSPNHRAWKRPVPARGLTADLIGRGRRPL
jgi:hypothetical protein